MQVLTVNRGSSSMKAALYRAADSDERDGLRLLDTFAHSNGGSDLPWSHAREGDPDDPLVQGLLQWLGDRRPDAVGHRVVHGGPTYREHVLITDSVLENLRRLSPIDPTHMPQTLAAVAATQQALPSAAHVACFDTVFHRHMPKVARTYGLPHELASAGVIRYGFHGLSCEYITGRLQRDFPREAAGRVIIAHLGNGCSLTAVKAGVGVETTMGFSPTGGLVMGTRCGDLDPGVLLYLLQEQSMAADTLSMLLNKQSGLLGLSEISSDMRELLEQEQGDYRAREALDLFCYQAGKFAAALAVPLGGLDTLVFTGGIGEHAPEVRGRICRLLPFLGIAIDDRANGRHGAIISSAASVVIVRVMATDEDTVIARHTCRLAGLRS